MLPDKQLKMCFYWFQQASIFLPGETENIVTVEVSPEKKIVTGVGQHQAADQIGATHSS